MGHQMNIFRKTLKSNQSNQINIKLASLKTLTDSKNCSVSRVKFLFWLSLALIGPFSPVYIQDRLSEQFSESQAAYRTTFKVMSGYQQAATSSMKKG
jgi:hypothetical protein